MPQIEFDQRDAVRRSRGVPGPVFAGTIVVGIGVAVYYAIVKPLYLEPEKYSKLNKL